MIISIAHLVLYANNFMLFIAECWLSHRI